MEFKVIETGPDIEQRLNALAREGWNFSAALNPTEILLERVANA